MLLQFEKKHSSIATILTIWKCPKFSSPWANGLDPSGKIPAAKKNTLSSRISAMENGTFDGPCVNKKAKRCDQGGGPEQFFGQLVEGFVVIFFGVKIKYLAEITLIGPFFKQ